MTDVDVGQVPFDEAIRFFTEKTQIPTERWDDMLGGIHAKSFTVAGATNIDLLSDLYEAVKNAQKSGTTITGFRKRFDKAVEEFGWSYNGNRGWRTRVIFDTNLRNSYMAGKWDQFQRMKDRRPYLQYLTAGDSRVRAEHAAWHGTVLAIDDPWFDTHYPPNGWGCRCTIRSISKRQMDKEGMSVNGSPVISESRRVNPNTGEDYGFVPDGIDVGWNYNVGKAWLGPDIAFGRKALQLPQVIRRAVLSDMSTLAEVLQKPFASWAKKAFESDFDRGQYHAVGFLSEDVVSFLNSRDISLETTTIAISDDRLRRMRRSHKTGKKRGTRNEGLDISIPQDELEQLPSKLANPDAIFWEIAKKTLFYVFSVSGNDKKAKIVISVGFANKGVVTNRVTSGSMLDTQGLKNKNQFILISGGL